MTGAAHDAPQHAPPASQELIVGFLEGCYQSGIVRLSRGALRWLFGATLA